MLLFIDILSGLLSATAVSVGISSLITYIFDKRKTRIEKKLLEIEINNKKLKLSNDYSKKELELFIQNVLNQIKPRVFISYAQEDKEKALKLAQTLKDNDFEIWFDEFNLKLGDSISEKVSQGINHSSYYLLIITKKFLESSEWVSRELKLMIRSIEEYPNRKIIPLLFEKNIELPNSIKDRIYLDYSSNIDDSNNKLIKFLKENDAKTTANIVYK